MKILVVEDDTFTRRMLEKYLIDLGFDVKTAANGLEGWETFNQDEVHLVITDWMMPEMTGIDLIKKIRKKTEETYSYLVLLTAKDDKGEIVEGISAGADDYIVKPFHKEELAVRVRAGQRIVELQQKLFKANDDLKKLSVTDPLTGLYNRRALSEYFKKSQAAMNAVNIPYSFVMADIDHFKKINDVYGHDAGDMVLVRVAERISMNAPYRDMISRIGGEEFFLVLPGIDAVQASTISEEMRRDIEGYPFIYADTTRIPVTCSFGVYCMQSADGWDGEKCMKRADQALYRSKESGRNCVTLIADK